MYSSLDALQNLSESIKNVPCLAHPYQLNQVSGCGFNELQGWAMQLRPVVFMMYLTGWSWRQEVG